MHGFRTPPPPQTVAHPTIIAEQREGGGGAGMSEELWRAKQRAMSAELMLAQETLAEKVRRRMRSGFPFSRHMGRGSFGWPSAHCVCLVLFHVLWLRMFVGTTARRAAPPHEAVRA